MANRGIKIALPGYNAFTDTNPDHFALLVDPAIDYILIKEYLKASQAITSSLTVNHNLGYVPFCLVFGEVSSGVWRRLYSRDIAGFGMYYQVNSTQLQIFGTGNIAYHIFLDNVTSGAAPSVDTTPHNAFVVAKRGVNAELATDPNDFLFHSDYNTFKIILEATKSITLAASTNNQSFTEAHNQKFIPLIHAFAKRDSASQVFLANSLDVELYGPKLGAVGDVTFNYVQADATNIIFNFSNAKGSTVAVSIRYFVLEKVT